MSVTEETNSEIYIDISRVSSSDLNSSDNESDSNLQGCQIVDNYSHVSPNLVYVETSVPGPGCVRSDFNVQFSQGCDCLGDCSSEVQCPCLRKYGKNYVSKGQLLESKFKGPVLECNSECKCSFLNCVNRCVQRGPRKGLEVFISQDAKGYGLKSVDKIEAGEFICEYAGEVIGLDEAKRRFQTDTSKEMNYIFVLNEHISDSVITTCVDPAVVGNIGRYINHSCDPNAAVVPVRVDCPIPKLCIFALKTIMPGSEITYNYGDDSAIENDVEDHTVVSRKECLCGSSNCKKYLPFDKSLY